MGQVECQERVEKCHKMCQVACQGWVSRPERGQGEKEKRQVSLPGPERQRERENHKCCAVKLILVSVYFIL